jgi:hypothetical protein
MDFSADWTKPVLSTSSEETLKTSSRIDDRAFLLETPSIADVTHPKSRLYPVGAVVDTRLCHHDIQR